MRATGSLAKTTMDRQIERYKAILERHGIKVHLIKKYVDDVLVLVDNIKPGTRVENNVFVWKKSWEEEDTRKGISVQENTMSILRTLANTIYSFLEFTSEVSTSPTHPIPCLDSQVWIGKSGGQEPWFTVGEKD